MMFYDLQALDYKKNEDFGNYLIKTLIFFVVLGGLIIMNQKTKDFVYCKIYCLFM